MRTLQHAGHLIKFESVIAICKAEYYPHRLMRIFYRVRSLRALDVESLLSLLAAQLALTPNLRAVSLVLWLFSK